MRKYRILLCDDETEVLDVICRKIDWESIGLEYPVCARNGLEALELAEKHNPDIVLTDIRMPYVDGLELTRRLRNEYPNIRILIFSGFDQFEYAREAVSLDVEEYILKPLDSDALTAVFTRICRKLDEEYRLRSSQEMMEQYYLQALPVLRENFLSSLIQGKIPEERYNTYLNDCRMTVKGPLYGICVLYTSTSNLPEGTGGMMLTMSVRKLAEEQIRSEWDPHFFSYLGNTAVLISLKKKEDVRRFTDEMDRFCRLAKSLFNAVVTAGIGTVAESFAELPASYTGARQAVSYRVLYDSGKAISISEISPEEKNDENHEVSDNELHEIFKRIKLDDSGRVLEAVQDFLNNRKFFSVSLHQLFVMDLVGELCIFARSNGLELKDVFGIKPPQPEVLTAMSKEELKEWLSKICLCMQNLLRTRRNDTARSFVDKAKDYVLENYADADLTITTMCNILGVSAAYFSTVFKKETGTAFINYLTTYRMIKAEELLLNTEEKTYVIGQMVGYNDPNYFSYVFKKQFGVSPSRYRKHNES